MNEDAKIVEEKVIKSLSEETRSIKISVVITCHTRKQFLREAINSAIHQTFPRKDYEIIVVADFHDEEIEKYCKDYNVIFKYDDRQGIGAKMASNND